MDKRIRQITETMFDRPPFVYYVGQERMLPINEGKREMRTICSIEQNETHYIVSLADNEISQVWKEIPKCDRITIEYFVN
jgi:hypothetical protein